MTQNFRCLSVGTSVEYPTKTARLQSVDADKPPIFVTVAGSGPFLDQFAPNQDFSFDVSQLVAATK